MPNYGSNYILHQSPATNDQYGGRYATYTKLAPAEQTAAENARWAEISQKARMPFMPGISPWQMASLLQSPIPVQIESSPTGSWQSWINPATQGIVSYTGAPMESSEVYLGPGMGWTTLANIHNTSTALPAYNAPTTSQQTATRKLANAYKQQITFQPETDYNPFPNYYGRR